MIKKISMKNVNCYKSLTSLETDKRVNLVYGLNGTGKSTLSNYLYKSNNPLYSECSIDRLDCEILVYNRQFIEDYFFQPENLKCIFTLSKENKEAEANIRNAKKEIDKLRDDEKVIDKEITENGNELKTKKRSVEEATWEIKAEYSGGDRILEFCLEGMKGKKETLFNYLASLEKPLDQPQITVNDLKREASEIKGDQARKYDPLPLIKLNVSNIEKNQIFNKSIVGNESSTISGLIVKLNNSDWVKKGLEFISENIEDESGICPFCQERTITKRLVENIENYFDKTYQEDVDELNNLLRSYKSLVNLLPDKDIYKKNPIIMEKKSEFDNLFNEMVHCFEKNKTMINSKIQTPSQLIVLNDSSKIVSNLNNFIGTINIQIEDHNKKIRDKNKTLKEIKDRFWNLMRWKYDQYITSYESDKGTIESKLSDLEQRKKQIKIKIGKQKGIVLNQQKKTINIEEAIMNINEGLLELGIDGFHIKNHKDNLYRIVRNEPCGNTFQSLSEGEKMIISFLYFKELCKGKRSASSISNKRIVVIDDPISSLSHIYIFNIGRMIKKEFFESLDVEQIFLLTHSLYFFYEMTERKHGRREEKQKLFRINKNKNGSRIVEMKYEDIQNDYHSYWCIVKDESQSPALIANCMRNIIEYFFNFIEKKDLNGVFQKKEFKTSKFEAFHRYINRESHSLGQNIFDIKEFDYNSFKDAFHMVFKESGFENHYNKMMS